MVTSMTKILPELRQKGLEACIPEISRVQMPPEVTYACRTVSDNPNSTSVSGGARDGVPIDLCFRRGMAL